MKRRNKKRNRNNRPVQNVTPSVAVTPPVDMTVDTEEPIKNLLFRPLIYRANSSGYDRTIDFEHLLVPFMIKDNKVFLLMFMDSCGRGTNIYTECYEMDPDQPCTSYRDGMSHMKECLDVERLTGTQYYFGHLDKAVDRYLYAMQLFVNKGILEEEKAVELVTELDATKEDMHMIFMSIDNNVTENKIHSFSSQAQQEQESDDGLTTFLMHLMSTGNADNEESMGDADNEESEVQNEETPVES